MDILVLGSGTITSLPERNPAGYVLQEGKRRAIMDMGPGILGRMGQTGFSVSEIDTVFLSHFHPDHCADLLPFLLSRFLSEAESNTRLQIVGPTGLNDWFDSVARQQGRWLERRPRLVEPGPEGITWADYKVRAFPNGHTEGSVAFRFDGRVSFFYSGDTPYSEALAELMRGCRCGILECSFPDGIGHPAHLTAAQAGLFASRAGLERVYLTHIYPANDTRDLADRVSRYFAGEVVVVQDLFFIGLDREI